jgi:hypothetical protein
MPGSTLRKSRGLRTDIALRRGDRSQHLGVAARRGAQRPRGQHLAPAARGDPLPSLTRRISVADCGGRGLDHLTTLALLRN